MKFINTKSIKTKLLIPLVILVIIGFSAVGFFSYYQSRNIIIRDTEQLATAKSHKIMTKVEDYIGSWSFKAEMMADAETVKSAVAEANFDKVKDYVTRRSEVLGKYESMLVAFPDGRALNTSSSGFVNISDRDYFIKAMKGQVAVSDPVVSKATGNRVVVVAAPVKDANNNIEGILAFTIDITELTNMINEEKLGESGYAAIINNSGLAIIHPNKDMEMKFNVLNQTDSKELADIGKKAVSGQEGVDSYTLNGAKKIMAYSFIEKTNWSVIMIASESEALAAVSRLGTISLIVEFIVLAVISGILLYLVNKFLKPILKISEMTKVVADGDLRVNIDITSDDEIGTLAHNFNTMIHKQKEAIVKVLGTSETLSSASEEISSTTEELTSTAQNQSQIVEEFTSTIEEMDSSIQDNANNISKVAANVNNVSASISEMGNSVQDTAKSVEDAAASINQVSASIEQMGESIKTIANHSNEAKHESLLTVNKAKEGNMAVNKTIEEMDTISSSVMGLASAIKELGSSAEKVGDIVNVIDDIAEQTNLLSLNAAIEAARAGDAGKGFAVVANSIRSLAERSGEATKDIAKLIKGIQNEVKNAISITNDSTQRVNEGAQFVNSTGQVFEDIFDAINKSSSYIEQISNAISEQEQSTKEVVKAVEKLSEFITQLSATTEEQAAGSDEIIKSVNELNNLVQQISAATEQQAASSQEVVKLVQGINRGTSEVSAGSEEIAASTTHLAGEAQELMNMVGQFKVK